MNDDVNHPSHYTQGKIEVHEFILDQDLPWDASNVIKYICRYRFKGTPVKDLKKAMWYLQSLIKQEEEKDASAHTKLTYGKKRRASQKNTSL